MRQLERHALRGKFDRIVFMDHGNPSIGASFGHSLSDFVSDEELANRLACLLSSNGSIWLYGCDTHGPASLHLSIATGIEVYGTNQKTKFDFMKKPLFGGSKVAFIGFDIFGDAWQESIWESHDPK
jgi:hypothetical protein